MFASGEEKAQAITRGKDLIAQQIFEALQKRDFGSWFATGDWDAFISADEDAPSESQILNQIKNLFKLN